MTATIKVYRHGLTAGVIPSKLKAQTAVRGDCKGWSLDSSRGNTRFLFSVREDLLTGFAVACSLTIRDCPPTHEDWSKVRRAWIRRMERMGAIRGHWLTEWQRRGFPHLHLAVWFPEAPPVAQLREAWLELTQDWGSAGHCQQAVPIWDVLGWNQYVSKHAARGLAHYQRSPENIPETWRTGTGRMWGKLGDWQVQEPLKVEMADRAFWAFRRMVRGWRRANARDALEAARKRLDARRCLQALRRVKSARGMLRCPLPDLSRVRGVSEWISEGLSLRMLEALSRAGHDLTSA